MSVSISPINGSISAPDIGLSKSERFAAALFFVALAPSFFISSNLISAASAIVLFPIALALHVFGKTRRSPWGMPFGIVCLVLITLFSSAWSYTPRTTFELALRGTLPMVNIFLIVGVMSPQLAWRVFIRVLGLSIMGSLVAVAILPSAVHSSADSLIAGSWRGLFYHKNGAGPVAAIAVLIFLESYRRRRRFRDVFLLLCSVVFLVGTQSKTSMILVVFGVWVFLLVRGWYARGYFQLFAGFAFLFAVFLAIVLISFPEVQAALFDNPYNFTGRVGIWKTALAISESKPYFGYGFRSVFGSDDFSLIGFGYTPFAAIAPHPHNAYIQALLGIGLVGMLIAIWALVIQPLSTAIKIRGDAVPSYIAICVTIIAFSALRGVFESNVMQFGRPGWIVWPVCYAILLAYKNQTPLRQND